MIRSRKAASWLASIAAAALAVSLVALAPAFAETAAAPKAASAAPSEAEFTARIQAAYQKMTTQDGFEAGYVDLRGTLADAAKTDLYAFTVKSYSDTGAILLQNQIIENAEEILADGLKTKAMQQDVKERADFYLTYGQVKQAEKDYHEVVTMFGKATNLYAQYYGNESKQVLYASDLFSVAIAEFGSIASAINLEQRTLEIAARTLGPDDLFTVMLQNNLADLLRQIGSPSRARDYDLNVLAKRTAHYGLNHYNVLVSANNLGQDYVDLADYDNAIKYFQQSKDIAVALKQDEGLPARIDAWIFYTRILAGLQTLDEKAANHLETVINDANYPDILRIRIASMLADHFADTDPDWATAVLDFRYQLANAAFGPANPLTFNARLAIAVAKAKTAPADAEADFSKLEQEMIFWINSQVTSAGGRTVAEAVRALADDMLYEYGRFAETDPGAVMAFADAARRWPTLEDGRRDNMRRLLRIIDPNDAETRRLLRNVMRFSYAYSEVTSSGEDYEKVSQPLKDQWDRGTERLNAIVADKYGFTKSDVDKPLPLAQDLLGEKQALVDYFITRRWRADRESAEPFEDQRLYAIVSRKGKAPQLFMLGDPRQLLPTATSEQVASLALTRSADTRGAEPLPGLDTVSSDLYGRLLAPLEPALQGADTLLIVPDGQLFAVPFPLLKDKTGSLIEDRYTLRMLTRPEALYELSANDGLQKGGKAVVAGGLDYSNGTEKGAEPLPATKTEIEAVAAILRKDDITAETFTGTAAREKPLREAMQAASIAHLATHGAYRDGGAGTDALWQSEVILSQSGDKRSMKFDDDDGRLYAMEIMNWDLSGVDLLVLSACETGRGKQSFVGGLRGLPTAINIAGAKRSLLTLWPVSDEGTAAFITRFYERLSGGESYPEALRQTRRDARTGALPAASDPRVWAAFVMFEN